jgi:shikimate dehydrogenase
MAERGMLPELGVIGWPLAMTFSPAMHEAALKQAGLGWRYERLPVSPAELDGFVSAARQTMLGINVTMPHKQALANLCTSLDILSSVSGAANTVVFRNGQGSHIRGFNTDGPGLLKALAGRAGFEPAGKTAMMLGAGGSAVACAAQLAMCGAQEVIVVNRTLSRAEALCERLAGPFPRVAWTPLAVASGSLAPIEREATKFDSAAERSDLVLSCVPASGHGVFSQIVRDLRPGTVFMDLAYSSSPTALHQIAEQARLLPVPGLEMLLWQAALSFEIFAGAPAPVDAMRKALRSVTGGWWSEC